MNPQLGHLIGSAIVFGLIVLLGRILGRGAGSDHPGEGVRILGYQRYLRGFAVCCGVLMPLIVLIMGWLSPPRNESEWWSWGGLIVVPGLLGGYMMLEAFKTRVALTQDGIAKFHWWYRPRFVAWTEVVSIESRLRTWGDYAVRTRTGTPIGVPGPMYFGPGEWFREACREHLQPNQYPKEFAELPKG